MIMMMMNEMQEMQEMQETLLCCYGYDSALERRGFYSLTSLDSHRKSRVLVQRDAPETMLQHRWHRWTLNSSSKRNLNQRHRQNRLERFLHRKSSTDTVQYSTVQHKTCIPGKSCLLAASRESDREVGSEGALAHRGRK